MLDACGKETKTFRAKLEEYPSLRSWLEETLAALHAPMKPLQQILISSDEIFTNIASYAYPDSEGEVEVSLHCDGSGNMFSMIFTDWGIPFNPLLGAAPDTTAPLSERKIGGLGILMVKKLMDAVEYQFKDGHNVLTLRKSLAPLSKESK